MADTKALAGRRAPAQVSSAGAVLVPFVVSRVYSDALLVLAGPRRRNPAWWSGFVRWDGRWYQLIARFGYTIVPPHAQHHQTPWPFFPLFPMLMRMVASTGLPLAAAGVLVNHVAFLVALFAIHRIALRHLDAETAGLSVWIVAFGPLSFVFSMLYPSAVFLAASTLAFLAVEEHRDLAAGAAAAVAALSRPDGLVVALALLVAIRFAADRILPVLVPSALALMSWSLYNATTTGDPVRFLDAKAAWREIDVLMFIRHPTFNAGLQLAIAVGALGVVLLARAKFPPAWRWYTAMYLLPSLGLGIIGMARYASEVFPAYLGTARLVRSRRAFLGVLAVLVVGHAACCYLFIATGHVI